MLTDDIKKYINQSVLCWLATVSNEGMPNVSPKEIFTYEGDSNFLIANIASPQSMCNIKNNSKVCVSFVDIFVQKGYQLKGDAQIITKTHSLWAQKSSQLSVMAGTKFPITAIIDITITKIKPILAPSYQFFSETTEAEQIENAMKQYGVSKGI